MTIVVDASCMVAALLDSHADGRWAASVLESDDIAGPELVLVETANVLRRLEQAKRITQLEATSAHRDLLRANIEIFPYEPLAQTVWQRRANLTSYDATYTALAESLGARLATLDIKLARTASKWCRCVTPERS